MSNRSTLRSLCAALGLALAVLAGPGPALGQRQAPDEATLLRRRVVLLEDRVARLERQLVALQEERDARRAEERRQELAVGPSYLDLSRGDAWRDRENWRHLRRGLSQLEVRYLLGRPRAIAARDFATIWYYPGPEGGSVHFDALGGRVEGWAEPW